MKKEIARDPWQPRLKAITADEKVRGGLPAWIIRSYDAESTFDDPKTKGKT